MTLIPSRSWFNVRVKILIIFLSLAIVALLITGYVAFFSISDVGKSAETSSLSLGQEAVDETTTALQASAEEHLVRIASDQAEVTNVLFENTDSEMEILAAAVPMLADNPPVVPKISNAGSTAHPADRLSTVLVVPSPDPQAEQDSTEFRTLAGIDDLLVAVFRADTDMSSIYVASDSGILRIYPWSNMTSRTMDPRQRVWFTGAKNTDGISWSDPYDDSAGHGLVVTASKAVPTKFGTWVIGSDVTVDVINEAFLNLTLGNKGYAILMDSQGNIISRPGLSAGNTSWDKPFEQENVFESNDPGLIAVGRNMTAGKTGIEKIRFNGHDTYVAYAPVTSRNWSFAVSMPVDEITAPVDKTREKIAASTRDAGLRINSQTDRFLWIFVCLFLILILVVILLAAWLARIITRPVESLKEGTLALGHGDLDFRLDIRTGDEFEDLAGAFNHMAADLKQNIEDLRRTTAEKERYTKEMEIAKEIQQNFLPESAPEIPEAEICAITIPAMEIGGDLYDFIPVVGNRWAFVIADVSGKGVSAALFMALSRTLIHATGGAEADPSAAIRQANRLIYEDGRSSMFITVFYGLFDPGRMTFSYVNAGHNPPLLIRDDPPVTQVLESRGIALGVVPVVDIPATAVPLRHGDLIVMYTDGVTEAFNEREACFGEDRLVASITRNRSRTVQEIMAALLEDIRQFCGNAPQSDDITLIVIRVK
ncbi:SpoIIE family protein phosphatase [Methanoregula sp.]|jgi:phosphoserine phosphatase RsbU/P|uniref:SpoIIE family protein phosphatase n=1 Tax=Methanoregula sp. TaxID=2052170 RepID=UPI003C1D90CE